MIRFANPEFLVLLIFVPLLAAWFLRRRVKSGTVRFSNLGTVKSVKTSRSGFYRHVLLFLRLAVITLLIVAFARPQSGTVRISSTRMMPVSVSTLTEAT